MLLSTSLPRQKPAALGVNANGIISFLDAIQETGQELHSFMLLRHGAVAAETWWSPYTSDSPHTLFSLSKSFTATAIGIAVDEGLLSIHDRVVTFFPDDLPEEPAPHLLKMTIRDLLIMGTGHDQDTSSRFNHDHWVQCFLALPVEHEPGTHFTYNNGATYMLSAILQKVTGMTTLDYLTSRLFQPLGIAKPTWDTCPRGISAGGWGLKLTTEDIAKFGQLFLNKGVWNGQRIVSEEWIEEAASKQISNGDDPNNDWNQGYGYQMWMCRHHAVRGDGMYGQYCILLPELDAVIAITSASTDMGQVLNEVWNHLLPAMTDGQLAEDEDLQKRLNERLVGTQYEPLTSMSPSYRAQQMSGIRYQLEDNPFHVEEVSLQCEQDGSVVISLLISGEHLVIPCGNGIWEKSRGKLFAHEEEVAACAAWQDENTLFIHSRMVETPFTSKLIFSYGEPEMKLTIQYTVGGKCEHEHTSVCRVIASA